MSGMKIAGATLANVVKIAKAFDLADISMTLGPTSLSIIAVDPARVSIVSATYEALEGPETPITVVNDVGRLKDAVEAFKAEVVEVTLEGHYFCLRSGRKVRRIATIDPRNAVTPKIPDLTWPLSVTVPTVFLADAASQSSKMTTATLSVANGHLTWHSEVDGLVSHEDAIPVDCQGTSTCGYSPNYLADIFAFASDIRVVLDLGNDMPLRASFQVPGGKAVVLLAPRI